MYLSDTDGSTPQGSVELASRLPASPEGAFFRTPVRARDVLRSLFALGLLFLFLVGVQSLSAGIKGFGKDSLASLMLAVEHPLAGLVTGILATTLVQSSSVTTSLMVGMVAGGVLPFSVAVPMVMGANIGTTVTNTVAALMQVGHRAQFRRAFAAATVHDFFNYLTVVVLLPLELATGFLSRAAYFVNQLLPAGGGVTYNSPLKAMLKGCVGFIKSALGWVIDDPRLVMSGLALVGVLIIFFSLMAIVRVMKKLVLSRVESVVRRLLGQGWVGSLSSVGLGIGLTVAVQSSSITSSLLVPLAGTGLVRLRQVFPVTVGANIGTTVTALLASMAITGPSVMVARQIAIVHLLFNLGGFLVFYIPQRTRRLPMLAARWLATVATRSRRWALAYVAFAFYGLPIFFLMLAK